jgi:hypothetical protein
MLALAPYLALAVTLIVALWSFKRAAILQNAARALLFQIEAQQTAQDVGRLADDIADQQETIQQIRDSVARIQGRATKNKALAGKLPDAASDPAAWKREMRKQLAIRQAKGDA